MICTSMLWISILWTYPGAHSMGPKMLNSDPFCPTMHNYCYLSWFTVNFKMLRKLYNKVKSSSWKTVCFTWKFTQEHAQWDLPKAIAYGPGGPLLAHVVHSDTYDYIILVASQPKWDYSFLNSFMCKLNKQPFWKKWKKKKKKKIIYDSIPIKDPLDTVSCAHFGP